MDKFKLEYEIKKNGFTIEKLCEDLGFSRSAFYRKCNGKSEFTLGEIQKIMTYLDIVDPVPIFFNREVS